MQDITSQKSSIRLLPSQATLQQNLLTHILHMKSLDPDYARYALRRYHDALPWLELMDGVRDALKGNQ